MKCNYCNQEKPYFDMQVVPLTDEQKTYSITPTKNLICPKCLGWEEPKKLP